MNTLTTFALFHGFKRSETELPRDWTDGRPEVHCDVGKKPKRKHRMNKRFLPKKK